MYMWRMIWSVGICFISNDTFIYLYIISLFFIFINIPFFLQITDLGIYLMFNRNGFLQMLQYMYHVYDFKWYCIENW